MTSPAPGDLAKYTFGGPIRNDATLGLVVDWQTAAGGSGSAQLAQLPPPTDIQPAAAQRDAVITAPTSPEPPIGTVLLRQTPRIIAVRTANGWVGRNAVNGNDVGPAQWSDLTGQFKIIWLGTGT